MGLKGLGKVVRIKSVSVSFASQVTGSGLGFSHLQMEVMILRKVLLGFGAGTAACAMWLFMERARGLLGKQSGSAFRLRWPWRLEAFILRRAQSLPFRWSSRPGPFTPGK